jgi:hypothetical protein
MRRAMEDGFVGVWRAERKNPSSDGYLGKAKAT